jgi:ribosomal protein S18 acetylase RimI-like enzyme
MTDRTREFTDVTIRSAAVDEIDVLIQLRLAMFEAMGTEKDVLTQAIDPMRDYFQEHLPSGAFRVWVAEHQGEPIASIGLVIHSIPPSPKNLIGKEAYVMNLVTLPEFRRRGIAKKLLLHVLDTVRSEGMRVVSLHASAEGHRLYEGLGFAISESLPEMHLMLKSFDSQ